MRMLIPLACVLLVACSAQAEPLSSLTSPYLKVQVALTADSFDGVRDAARELAAAAADVGGAAGSLVKPAETLAGANDINAAREAFGPLSDAFIEHVSAVGLGELKVVFCPMANKSWVQKTGAIANPFYGSTMLTCGVFR